MGNCISLESDIRYECTLCLSELDKKYVYCAYCNKRFHTRCIKKQNNRTHNCPMCNQQYLRLISKHIT